MRLFPPTSHLLKTVVLTPILLQPPGILLRLERVLQLPPRQPRFLRLRRRTPDRRPGRRAIAAGPPDRDEPGRPDRRPARARHRAAGAVQFALPQRLHRPRQPRVRERHPVGRPAGHRRRRGHERAGQRFRCGHQRARIGVLGARFRS